MLAAEILGFTPHGENITDPIVHLEGPVPPASSEARANPKPTGIAVELAINHRPPRRTFREKAIAEMAETGRAVPRSKLNPHITEQFHRPEQRSVAVNASAVTRRHAVESRRIPHAYLVEQPTLDQLTAGHFVAGNDAARRDGIREASSSAKCGRNERATVSTSFIHNARVDINKGERPRFSLIGNTAVTIRVNHGRILAKP